MPPSDGMVQGDNPTKKNSKPIFTNGLVRDGLSCLTRIKHIEKDVSEVPFHPGNTLQPFQISCRAIQFCLSVVSFS
jgi:hypothetical protein